METAHHNLHVAVSWFSFACRCSRLDAFLLLREEEAHGASTDREDPCPCSSFCCGPPTELPI
jgi:hypothetical protein